MNLIELSPGVKEPLTGYQWLWQHQHDLDGWQPRIELDFGNGTTQSIQGKPDAVMEAVKINLKK
jgi:hypothetical protein